MTDFAFTSARARHFRTWRSVLALMLREMSTTFGRSPGGYLWAIVEPIATIAIMSAAFELLFRAPVMGTSFPLFFATGLLPFSLAVKMSVNIAKSLRFSKTLLEYPGVTWVDAILARAILAIITELTSGTIIFAGMFWILDINVILSASHIVMSVGMAATLGMGLGALNCYLFTTVPLYERVYSIVTRPLMIMSGVIFPFEAMPPSVQAVLWYNPFVHVVSEMREGFYVTYDAQYVSGVFVFLVSFTALALGLLLLKQHHKALLNM